MTLSPGLSHFSCATTNKLGSLGMNYHFVLCREVVLSSEIKICGSNIGKSIIGALKSVLH